MEFSRLGSHCALESCHRLDWLPFECDYCHLHFCLDHRSASSHSCAHLPAPTPPPSLLRHSYINPHRCTAPHCHTREALPNTCRNCGSNFCLKHRMPTSHPCNAAIPRNVIRKVGQGIPQSSALLKPVHEVVEANATAGQACAAEVRKEESAEEKQRGANGNRGGNTNVAHSRLLQRPQKAH